MQCVLYIAHMYPPSTLKTAAARIPVFSQPTILVPRPVFQEKVNKLLARGILLPDLQDNLYESSLKLKGV